MELPKDRLTRARRDAGYESASDAARAHRDINVNTLISHENGNRAISRKAAQKYGDAFGVPAGWILFGENVEPSEPTIYVVPVLAMISAGILMRDDVTDEALGTIRLTDLPPGDWIALKVVGVSMDRISPPESTILVNRRDRRLVPNGLYIIADEEGNATYKRYRPNPQRFEPVSTDLSIETIFPQQEPTIIGRVRRTILDT